MVGEAPHGVAALEAIPRVQPDAVFLDVQMPGLSGFEVLDDVAGEHGGRWSCL